MIRRDRVNKRKRGYKIGVKDRRERREEEREGERGCIGEEEGRISGIRGGGVACNLTS